MRFVLSLLFVGGLIFSASAQTTATDKSEGTTTLDALWMGVPVVTLSGATALERAGVSIAMNLGLPELVAQTPDEFVDRAAALAHDWDHLSALRETLRARLQASPLGDAPRFARNIEATYRALWRRYCAKR